MGLKKLNLNQIKEKVKAKVINYKSLKKEKETKLRLTLEKRRRKELDELIKKLDRILFFKDPTHSKQPLTFIERNKQLIKEIKKEEFKSPFWSLLSNAQKFNSVKKNQILLRQRYSANLLIMLLKEYSAKPLVAKSIKIDFMRFEKALFDIANNHIELTFDKAEFVIKNINICNKSLLQTTSLLELSNRVKYFAKSFEKLSKLKVPNKYINDLPK